MVYSFWMKLCVRVISDSRMSRIKESIRINGNLSGIFILRLFDIGALIIGLGSGVRYIGYVDLLGERWMDIIDKYSSLFDPGIPDYVFFLSFWATSLLIAILLIIMKGLDIKRTVMGILLAECIFIIYCSTVIYRETLPEPHSNFMPFWSYQAIWGDCLKTHSSQNVS